MRESTIKEKVLKKIRNALIDRNPNPNAVIDHDKNVFHKFDDDAEIQFAHRFTELGGNFIYCESHKELEDNLRLILNKFKLKVFVTAEPLIDKIVQKAGASTIKSIDRNGPNIALTTCEFLVARFGTIALSSYENRSRQIWPMADIHVVLAEASQVKNELKDGISFLQEKYGKDLPSQITFVSGPSRTADIEKTLVKGVHGPGEIFVLYVDEL